MKPNKVSLCCLLETQYCCRLELQVCLEVLGNLPHQPLERQLSDEQRCVLLEVTDVIQSCRPHPVSVGFHQPPLHPHLVDLPQLFWSPVQYTVAQYGSLLLARDIKDWQVSVYWGVSCACFAWFFTGHNWLWWSTFTPCLPALVRLITVTVAVLASLSALTRVATSGPAYATCAGTVTCAGTGRWLLAWFALAGATCTASGLLAHLGPVCQLKTFAVRAVLVPVDFWHWDLLPVLVLEVGDELPHLVGTPASFFKSFLQASCKTVVNKESCKRFSRGQMSWACWQNQVYLLLHMLWCSCSLCQLGVLIRGVLQHHLPVRTSPGLRVCLRVLLSSSHCQRLSSCVFPCCLLGSRHATGRPPPHVCTEKGLYLSQGHSSFI